MIEDTSVTLPPGWATAKIGELIGADGIFIDGDWIESKDQNPNGEIRLIQLADIGDGVFINKSSRFLTYAKALDLRCSFLEQGDLLIARMPEPLGRACIFPGGSRRCVTVVDVCIVRCGSSSVVHRWLMYAINSPDFRSRIHRLQSGSTRRRISRGNLSTLELPIPPKQEQHRIVEEIEEQFSRLDAGIAALETAQIQLKHYRSAVLQDACEGRLVPAEAELARQEGRPYEPASVLLQRILAERRTHWEAEQQARMEAQGKLPSDDAWKSRYAAPDDLDTSNLPELPEGWDWVSINQVSEVGTGATPLRSDSTYYVGGKIPWVTSGVVNNLFVDAASEFITERAVQETNAKVFPAGSLLIAMYGEGRTRGRVTELRIDAATNQACAALLFDEQSQLCKPYVKYFLIKNYEDMRRLASGGVQPNLNLTLIKTTPLPLPPLAEQRRIVEEIDRQFSVIEQSENDTYANLQRAERMRQIILERAFSGQLVPQDPNDEPADVLLERIRIERAAALKEAEEARRAMPRPTASRRGAKMRNQTKNATRPLRDTLAEADAPLTPEQLFAQAGFERDVPDSVDAFYEQLRTAIMEGLIIQERPNSADVLLRAA